MARNKSGLLPIIVVGFLLLVWSGKLPGVGDSGIPDTQGTGEGKICTVEDTTFTFLPQDTEARGTIVDVSCKYWLDGDYIAEVKNANAATPTAVTVSPGDKMTTLAVLYANGTQAPQYDNSDFATAAVSYYGTRNDFIVPCRGTYNDNLFIYKADSTAHNSYNSTCDSTGDTGKDKHGLTMIVFNEDDQVVTNGTNDITLGTGIYHAQVKLKVDNDMYFSNPESDKGILLCFDAGSALAEFDNIEVTSHGAKKASVPDMLLGTADWCWELTEVKSLKDGQSIYVDVDIDGDDSDDPDADDDVGIWVVDADYYVDGDTGELLGPDYEDEDGNDVGLYTDSADSTGSQCGSAANAYGEKIIYVGG